MRIGELSKQSGLSRDTIRFYERRGLIASVPETGGSNSYRDYPDDLLAALAWIKEAQDAGLTLDDLTVLMRQLAEFDTDDDFDGIAFLDEKIGEVETRIKRSRKFLATLRQTRSALINAPNG